MTAPTRHALRADAQGAAPRHRFLLPDDVPFPRKLMPPGPRQLPTVGSFHHVLLSCHGGLPHRALRELAGRHVPLMLLRFGDVPALVVSSAEAARES